MGAPEEGRGGKTGKELAAGGFLPAPAFAAGRGGAGAGGGPWGGPRSLQGSRGTPGRAGAACCTSPRLFLKPLRALF